MTTLYVSIHIFSRRNLYLPGLYPENQDPSSENPGKLSGKLPSSNKHPVPGDLREDWQSPQSARKERCLDSPGGASLVAPLKCSVVGTGELPLNLIQNGSPALAGEASRTV